MPLNKLKIKMDDQKAQIVDKLKQANNILVTVSSNPTVDQLSAAIGLTLFLNHLGKHASAVFSGKIPSTLEFLQPEKTLEKTTYSLRDFIISLDKAKADKLRYKVEDQMVKIFITPYQTSISEKDLEFSHGDFNVEAVIALGVKEQGELDQSITAHGRILHDATVIGVGASEPINLGSINWNDDKASSLCEMITSLSLTIKPEALDGQIATALLTGIVAQTERFSNEKTSSETMQLSSKLMSAGANQQLVASQLQQPEKPAATPENTNEKPNDTPDEGEVTAELPEPKDDDSGGSDQAAPVSEDKAGSDGSLQIAHGNILPFGDTTSNPAESAELEQIHIDENGTIKTHDELQAQGPEKVIEPPSDSSSRLVLQPPTLGSQLTANTQPEDGDTSIDPLSSTSASQPPLLSHDAPAANPEPTPDIPAVPSVAPINSLADLEKSVDSPHTDPTISLDAARDAVDQAAATVTPSVLEPVQALNAQPVDLSTPAIVTPVVTEDVPKPTGNLIPPDPGLPVDPTAATVTDPTAPPPVPPPMMPPMMPPTNPPADGSPNSTAL
jgi:hypothetical protein